MSLEHYGVLIGTFDHFEKENEDDYGKWFHGFVFVRANQKIYRCAVDVNKPDGGFQYMTIPLQPKLFTKVSSMADGYHELAKTPDSGAIDYIRSPIIQQSEGCLLAFYALIKAIFHLKKKTDVWITNTGDKALNALQNLVKNSVRLYMFGAPFHDYDKDGMHDVHMNQGDPPGPFYHLNGIWQDGCVIVERPGDVLKAYLGKFVTQSLKTDDNGNPIE